MLDLVVIAPALLLVGAVGGALFVRYSRSRLFQAALDEQLRRETEHHLAYRPDQRQRAIQQRLSRKLGKKAWSEKTLKRIKSEMERHVLKGK